MLIEGDRVGGGPPRVPSHRAGSLGNSHIHSPVNSKGTSTVHVPGPRGGGRNFRFAGLIDECLAAGKKVAMFVPSDRAEEARERFPGATVITPDDHAPCEPALELTEVWMEEREIPKAVFERMPSGVHDLPIRAGVEGSAGMRSKNFWGKVGEGS
jgi:hypothetical protein